MSSQDDLKARARALVSRQIANWAVDIQSQIADNQAGLVKALDELTESVARYDEKIDAAEIGRAIAEVAAGVSTGGGGAAVSQLKQSMARIEAGTNLDEVLAHLVNEASTYVERTAIFVVRQGNAIGWSAKGFPSSDGIEQLNVPLSADTIFKSVQLSHATFRGHISQSAGTGQVISRLGGSAGGILGVPLTLRDEVSAVLYCDTTQPEVAESAADAVEMLVAFAGKTLDVISLTPEGQTPSRTALAGTASGPPAAALTHLPEEQRTHEEAKRFARLVVSEIRLYNKAKVDEGRRKKDIYGHLKEDIERGRRMYANHIQPNLRDSTSYFQDELIRILAEGDASALGPM